MTSAIIETASECEGKVLNPNRARVIFALIYAQPMVDEAAQIA